MGLTIKKDGYLSNVSAMQMHQITLQISKTIFVRFNQNVTYNTHTIHLKQDAVENAFSKPQCITTEIYKSGD